VPAQFLDSSPHVGCCIFGERLPCPKDGNRTRRCPTAASKSRTTARVTCRSRTDTGGSLGRHLPAGLLGGALCLGLRRFRLRTEYRLSRRPRCPIPTGPVAQQFDVYESKVDAPNCMVDGNCPSGLVAVRSAGATHLPVDSLPRRQRSAVREVRCARCRATWCASTAPGPRFIGDVEIVYEREARFSSRRVREDSSRTKASLSCCSTAAAPLAGVRRRRHPRRESVVRNRLFSTSGRFEARLNVPGSRFVAAHRSLHVRSAGLVQRDGLVPSSCSPATRIRRTRRLADERAGEVRREHGEDGRRSGQPLGG